MIILVVLGAIALILATTAYVGSERQLSRTWTVPPHSIAIPTDSASVARGSHLVNAVGTCATCHGEDLGGKVYADMGPIGLVAGPNLTPGRGGRGASFTDDDWVRAIRFGVRRDGTSLIAMPSEVFMNMSDADLGSVIAYLKQLAPIDRESQQSRFKPLGRALLASGRLKVLTAPKTPAKPSVASVTPGVTPAYGKYLAEISGCAGCHGYGLSGGRVAGPPGIPPAANITPAGIGTWTEADLRRVLREGRKPSGVAIDEFMPWKTYAGMTDDEISAIWLYLRSVPPKPFGNK
jgi:cytochrome c553